MGHEHEISGNQIPHHAHRQRWTLPPRIGPGADQKA
jgi:hypothetical protein